MVEIAAVGWVVSPVIKLIIDKTKSYISDKLFYHAGLEHDMRKMETTLLEILTIMVTVEKQRIEDQHQVKLVWKIKDAVYDAEDVIDEFDYNILEAKSEQQKSMVSRCISFLYTVFRNKYGKLKQKVKEVNGKLDLAKGSAIYLLELMNVDNSFNIQSHQKENQQVTHSNITDRIIGRNNECESLINLLKEQVEGSPIIIQITGQGGIGKTTLAQMAYNDPRVLDHFDQKMWLTVSNNFDKLRLTKEMLKYVCEPDNAGFEKLQEKLKTELASKKVLLVLDDVWCDMDDKGRYVNEKQWLEFLAPLNTAKAGSKIILTSRQGLWKSTSLSTRLFHIDGLNNVDSMSLFEMCAFDSENQHKRQELEPIGKEIVNKLKGLPLAIKVVGTQLRANSDVQVWRTMLNDNPLDTSDVMNILRLSYEHLPQHLKHCFAYCSIFHKNHYFKLDRLIHMWIAHGFVYPEERKSLEDVGKSYFKGLLSRSFFQEIKRGRKEYFVMHDLMNDLASLVSKGECYRLDRHNPFDDLGSIRHLSVTYEALNILKNIRGLDNLRTLMVVSSRRRFSINIENLLKFKRIRVLDIEFMFSNLCDIGQCKYLRYLSFRWDHNQLGNVLPDCFRNLHLLNALFVRQGSLIFRLDNSRIVLPKFFCRMSNLLFADISKSIFVDIGEQVQQNVAALRGSAYLEVKNNSKYGLYLTSKKNIYGLYPVGAMSNIVGRLEITGLENVTSREKAIEARLGEKECITNLKLEWGDSRPSKIDNSKWHEVLETLVPSHNLKSLHLFGYPGATWPSSSEPNLHSVKSIHLSRCTEINMLPSLGELEFLQDLHIGYLSSVRKISDEFYGKGTFPSLENLVIDSLESLEEWCYRCDTPVFPKLQKLEIVNCNKLITLEGLDELVSLQRFYIEDCPNLLSIPEMNLSNSLEFVAIFNCPNLSSFPSKGFPVSLRLLCIGGTIHHTIEDQIRNKNGNNWDKVAAISACHISAAFANQGDFTVLRDVALSIFKSETSIEDSSRRLQWIPKFRV